MAYNRNRNYRRTSSAGSRWMNLRYAGNCKVCGTSIPKGDTAYWDASARTVTCYAWECCEADGLTTVKPATGLWDKDGLKVRAERLVGDPAPVPPRVNTIRFNSGAVIYQNARGRCEDAPCCGCCS